MLFEPSDMPSFVILVFLPILFTLCMPGVMYIRKWRNWSDSGACRVLVHILFLLTVLHFFLLIYMRFFETYPSGIQSWLIICMFVCTFMLVCQVFLIRRMVIGMPWMADVA